MTTTTVRELSADERAEMARGKQVRVGGRTRTIPAASVPRYERMVEQVEAMFPGPERAHERRAALETAAAYLVEETAAEGIAEALHEAREAHEAAAAAARVFVVMAVDDD